MAEGRRDPQPGDLIEIKRSPVHQHWALYVGNDHVIHVADVGARDVFMSVDFTSTLTGTAKLKKELLRDVVGNHKWSVNNKYDQYHTPRPVEDIIRHAELFVGIDFQYNLMNNNCEHFVTMLRYDKKSCEQVEKALRGAAGAATVLAISAIIIASAKWLSVKKRQKRNPDMPAGVRNEERENHVDPPEQVYVYEEAEYPNNASLGHPN